MSESLLPIPYVDPTSISQQGVYSYPLKLSLKPGQVSYATNMRFFKDCWTSRKACRPLGSSTGTTPSGWNTNWKPRGTKLVTPNGNTLLLAAYADDAVPSQVRVYNVAQDGTHTQINSGFTWDDTGDWLYASDFSDLQSQTDYVIFGARGTKPRVWNGSTSGIVTGIVEQVASPKSSNIFRSQSGLTSFFTVSTAANTTFTNSDAANWAGADAGTGTDLYISYVRSTAASTNPTSLVTFTSAISGANARQFFLYVQPGTVLTDWLEYIKIELYDGTNYYTIHDPASTYARGARIEALSDTDEFWVFPVDAPPSGFVMSSVDGYRLTFTGGAPSSVATLNVLAAGFGGQVPGGAQYVVSYFNPTTRCESRGLAVETATGVRVQDIGGGEWGGVRLPISPIAYYQNTVAYLDTSSAENTAGVTRVRIYRAEASLDSEGNVTFESNALLVTTRTFTTADSAQTYTDNTASGSRITEIGAPSPYCQSLPPSTDVLGANGRMFALGALSATDSSGRYNTLWVSEDQQPMRFQQVVGYGFLGGLDDRSATRSKLESDVGARLVGLATADIGILTIFVFGRNAIYTLPGTDALSLSNPKISSLIGTNQPNSVAVYQNEMFWLGTDNQVRRGSASMSSPVSYERVEDQIPAYSGTNIWATFGAVCQGNYYLAMSTDTSTSLTKPQILVYEIESDIWHGLDTPPAGKSFDSVTSFRSDLLYCQSGLDGTIVRHDGGTSRTDGANVAGVLTEALITSIVDTGENASDPDYQTGFAVRNYEIIAEDQVANCQVTCNPIWTPGGASTGSATINLNVSNGAVWRVGRMPATTTNLPNNGYSMYTRFTFTTQAYRDIYRARAFGQKRTRTGSSA